MKRVGQVSAAVGGAFAGLAAALFLHPRNGARRRGAAAHAAKRQRAMVATLVGSSVGRTPARRRRRDEALEQEVSAALRGRFGAAAGAVRVTADHGTVTLRGEVDRLDDIDAYEAAARAANALDVNNLLRLAVTGPEAATLRSSS